MTTLPFASEAGHASGAKFDWRIDPVAQVAVPGMHACEVRLLSFTRSSSEVLQNAAALLVALAVSKPT